LSAQQQQQSDHPQRGEREDHAQVDGLRLWLVSGLHKFAVDPRRRLGGHGRARQVLSKDQSPAPEPSGAWQSLASTLDRHTVLGGMTELSPEERRVIMLAYIEGRTNREIAAVLGVSVGTVKRRLQIALDQLDTYFSRTGTWLFLVLLLGAGYAAGAANRLGRSVTAIGSADWTYKLASTAAMGVTVAAIGVAAISPDSTTRSHGLAPTTVRQSAVPPGAVAMVRQSAVPPRVAAPGATAALASKPRSGLAPPAIKTMVAMPDRSHDLGPSAGTMSEQRTDGDDEDDACGHHHHPTNAPPPDPEGSSHDGQNGASASHSTADGCDN
jgi:RNA polymerase sigma factor (sigma-70 family)